MTRDATPEELAEWWQRRRAGGPTILPNGEYDPGAPHPDQTAMSAALKRAAPAMAVAAIMPCRGRAEQTIRNVRRLLATAGDVEWRLVLVGSAADLRPLVGVADPARVTLLAAPGDRLTYWQAMQVGTAASDAPLIANLANDLLPGQHWLARGVAAYRQTWPGPHDYGLLGFNDGHHEVGHSCHFLIDRDLLTYLGGWPVWYDHAYGDTELCQKAIALGLYAKAPWAVLYHDHPYFGGDDDAVYAEGRAQVDRDYRLYAHRRAAGWPTVA